MDRLREHFYGWVEGGIQYNALKGQVEGALLQMGGGEGKGYTMLVGDRLREHFYRCIQTLAFSFLGCNSSV